MAKNALGKGLGALLSDDTQTATPQPREPAKQAANSAVGGDLRIPLNRIQTNPNQPRQRFDEETLAELAASIKQYGIIQPVIVDEGPDGYVIIAGERRYRAARLAGLTEIPVIVRNYTSEKRLEVALIENIHRADLNPIEEAEAYRRIMENVGLSQDETAARVGKNRSTVANALRLLRLPATMRESLKNGALSAGHARAILSLSNEIDQEKLYREITGKGLSVREAETLAARLGGKRGAGEENAGTGSKITPDRRDPHIKAMEEKFIEKLGTKVSITGGLSKGRIEIDYYSMDDLDRLYGLLGGADER
jgi:ParB family chromosome partitioning protein